MAELDEVRAVLESGKAVLGSDRTLKMLRQGKLQKVFLASNAPRQVQGDVAQHGAVARVPVVTLPVKNEELGTLCKKPFPISVIGVRSA